MRCKRHTVDYSSSNGVCASCLRERLLSLAASTAASENDHHHHRHHSKISPPPLLFPRSVSPYVSVRKSDAGVDSLTTSNTRFFATPQVGSTTIDQPYAGGIGESSSTSGKLRSLKKKRTGLSRFSSFFRTRSEDFSSRSMFSFKDSCDTSTFSPPSSSTSRSWLSKVLSVGSKKQQKDNTCYIEDLIASESTSRPRQRYCRGMSPAGSESVEESPGREKRTPAAMGTPGRRKTGTIGAGIGFCLSPLVRAKPNSSSSSNWKGRFPPPDFGYSGELKSPAKPHISTAASFCANRSKKLVDLGRVDPRR